MPSYKDYHIFIGECPHKDENGNWVTYENVPNFIISAFAGAHFIDKEPDIPHIIRIITDEFDHQISERQSDQENDWHKENYQLKQKVTYCTFGTYIKGLHERIKKHVGCFYKGKGERINQFGYRFPNYPNIVFQWDKTIKRLYLWIETDDWNRTLDFIKNGKLYFEWKKWKNDHCYCSC